MKIYILQVQNNHMSSSDIDRKIAVLFATDAVSYSKYMEKDEDATQFSFLINHYFKSKFYNLLIIN